MPLRLAVIVGDSPDASRVCRVDAPDRVLRIWAMLSVADNELHEVSVPPGTAARLQRQLDAFAAELERSLSPALAGELRHLFGREKAPMPTADELRIEYASLLAWTGGLVIGILTQIEAASAKTARPSPRSRLVITR
jgi:hypothetical protein